MNIISTKRPEPYLFSEVTFERNGRIINIQCGMGSDGGTKYASPEYTIDGQKMYDLNGNGVSEDYAEEFDCWGEDEDEPGIAGPNLVDREFNHGWGFALPFTPEYLSFLDKSIEVHFEDSESN